MFRMIRIYARVSTIGQDLKQQVKYLKNYASKQYNDDDVVITVYQEKKSGTSKTSREELKRLVSDLRQDDIVLVTKIDRLARSVKDLRELIDTINGKGATVSFIDNNLTFTGNQDDMMSKLLLNMLGAIAEFERDLIVSRTQAGKQYAKENNVDYREGRPKRVLNERYLHALDLCQNHTVKEVAKLTGLSEATIYRIKRQYKEEKEVKQMLDK